MEGIERLEKIEKKTMKIVDNVGEMMRLIALELKQEKVKPEVIKCLESAVQKVQDISEELHDIIDGLP